ncbi:unnamed protein product [Protopolystoma xenopodis]|uniref:Uncharacterized protein n=1 Tax=Protopolystoma xenopodis TaxID=117903 RepID=A0A448XK44_9PLAT|nr:unnamed protein product [Protopolystoma xenopodis]
MSAGELEQVSLVAEAWLSLAQVYASGSSPVPAGNTTVLDTAPGLLPVMANLHCRGLEDDLLDCPHEVVPGGHVAGDGARLCGAPSTYTAWAEAPEPASRQGRQGPSTDRLVGLRCHRPGWAGLRLAATGGSVDSRIQWLRVGRAGLLDAARRQFVAAVQMDYFAGRVEQIEARRSPSFRLVYWGPTGLWAGYRPVILRLDRC